MVRKLHRHCKARQDKARPAGQNMEGEKIAGDNIGVRRRGNATQCNVMQCNAMQWEGVLWRGVACAGDACLTSCREREVNVGVAVDGAPQQQLHLHAPDNTDTERHRDIETHRNGVCREMRYTRVRNSFQHLRPHQHEVISLHMTGKSGLRGGQLTYSED